MFISVYIDDTTHITKIKTPKITKLVYAFTNTGVNACTYSSCGIDVNGNALYLGHDIITNTNKCRNSEYYTDNPYPNNEKIDDTILLAKNIK